MSKKIVIVGITTKSYTTEGMTTSQVGEVDGIEKIIYEEHGYNKGKQGKLPAYVVFFTGSNNRTVIKESEVTRIGVEVIENKETIPELPENSVSTSPSEGADPASVLEGV